MDNEFYTLIVVPHAKARFRKIQIPVRFARWVAATAGAASLVFGVVFLHYLSIALEVRDLRRLRAENVSLAEKTAEYEKNVGKLQAKVVGLQKMVDKLGVMAGLDSALPAPGSAGMGGTLGAETEAPSRDPGFSLRRMDLSLTDLAKRSAKLESFYKDQRVLLASTPSVWPVRGYLSSNFGNRVDPFTGGPDFHPGIDIATPMGTKIMAPADGVVIACAEKGGYGNAIILDHGFGMVTRYAHLERYNVRPGQRVRRGDVIGFVGSTGRSQTPHLHYEVWVRDQAQNPIHFILDEYRSFG
jgi:murein DD-endopeptidase MepM/ murein hydrolase activator NlpD